MDISNRIKERVYMQLHACGVTQGSILLAAVSGGPDSVVLLHVLRALFIEGRIGTLHAAHFHHGIRGEHANTDAAFVQALCKEWGVPFTISYADVPRLAKEEKRTLEDAARKARYVSLRRARAECGASHILTAHHMDDQAETILLHLLRGSGLAGLCGMQAATGELLRPLLTTRKSELMEYIEACALPYRMDETNTDAAYLRNRVRLELLPLLQSSYNPNITQGLCHMAALLSEDEAYLTSLAEAALDSAALPQPDTYSRAQLCKLPPAIRTRALRLALSRAGALYDMQYSGITRLSALLSSRTGATMPLPRGLRAWISYDALHIGAPPESYAEMDAQHFLWPGKTKTPAGCFIASYADTLRKDEGPFVAYLDADKLPANILVRPRAPGDILYPLNAPGARKLKCYLIDKKIPRERRMLPMLASGSDIIFFPGGTISHDMRITAETTRILRVLFKE